MATTLRDLVESEKLISSPADWVKRDRRLELKLALEVEGVVEEGLFLRACALEHLADREVVFQLEYHGLRIPGGTGPLARLEWNPLRPHNNKGRGPKEWRWIDQVGSHFHQFDDNWSDASGALLKSNLPVSRPVSTPIQSFNECVDFVGIHFRINNIRVIKVPEWAYALDLGASQ